MNGEGIGVPDPGTLDSEPHLSGRPVASRSREAWLSRRCEGRDVEARGRERGVRNDSTISPRALGRNRTCDPRFRNSFQQDPLTSEDTPIGDLTSAFSSLQPPSLRNVSLPFAGPPRGHYGPPGSTWRRTRRRGWWCSGCWQRWSGSSRRQAPRVLPPPIRKVLCRLCESCPQRVHGGRWISKPRD